MKDKPNFVVVSGVIGVGKTTFTRQLAALLNWREVYEPVDDNPYLADFTKDQAKWAYPMQEFLKHRRFAAYQFAYWGLRHGEFPGVILDRSIHEDTVFAQINAEIGNINPRNWNTYLQGFQDFQAFLPEPDLYIFLDADVETCLTRIKLRGREAEGAAEWNDEVEQGWREYLTVLHTGYMRWLEQIAPRMQVVRLDWSAFRRVEDAWQDVLEQFEARSRFTRSLVTEHKGVNA